MHCLKILKVIQAENGTFNLLLDVDGKVWLFEGCNIVGSPDAFQLETLAGCNCVPDPQDSHVDPPTDDTNKQ